jgi:Nucleoside 2-deoxyribosyltransferase
LIRAYIAAPWVSRDLARAFASRCADRGIFITHPWWDYEGEFDEHAKMAEFARLDLEGVRRADVVILLNTAKSEGKAVEQGLALAWGKPIVAVGKLGEESLNIFHHLPAYTWVDDTEKVWEVLLGETH